MRPRRTSILVAAVLVASTLVFTWPLAARLGTHLAGPPGDNSIFAWNVWWFGEALWHEHRSPFYTPLLLHPRGADLAYHTTTLLGTVPGSVLARFLPLPVAFNLVVLGCFVFAGAAAYGLARHVLRRAGVEGPRAAGLGLFAALAYTFAPFHWAHLGHLNILNVGVVPLAAWAALRFAPRPTLRNSAALGAALGLCALADGYFVLIAGLLVIALLVFEGRTWQLRSVARPLAASTIVFLIVSSPVLVPMLRYGSAGLEDVQAGGANEYVADPFSYVLPSPFHPLWGKAVLPVYARLSGNTAENVVFPTFTVWVLALVAWRRRHRLAAPWGAEVRLWAVIALAFVILSFGPFLHLLGRDRIDIGDGTFLRLPLPKVLLDAVPLLSGARAAGRFAAAGQLALVLAAMLGLATLVRGRKTPRATVGAVAFAVAACLFECFPSSAPTTRVEHSAAYEQLAAAIRAGAPRGALLEVPPVHANDKATQFQQTVHGLPLLGGRLARIRRDAYDHLHRDPFLHRTLDNEPWQPYDALLSLAGLDSLGVEYVMLHRAHATHEAIGRVLARNFETMHESEDAILMRRRRAANAPRSP